MVRRAAIVSSAVALVGVGCGGDSGDEEIGFDPADVPGYEALGKITPPPDAGHGTCKVFLTTDPQNLPPNFYPPEVVGEVTLDCKTPAGEPVFVSLIEHSTEEAAANYGAEPNLGGATEQKMHEPTEEDEPGEDLPAEARCLVGPVFLPGGTTTTNRRCLGSIGRYTLYADVPIDLALGPNAPNIQANLRLHDRQDPELGFLLGVEWLEASVPDT